MRTKDDYPVGAVVKIREFWGRDEIKEAKVVSHDHPHKDIIFLDYGDGLGVPQSFYQITEVKTN